MPEPDPERDALRARLRRERSALAPGVVRKAATALARRLQALPEYRAAASLAAYLAMPGEMDPLPAMRHALRSGRPVYVPVVDGEHLAFAPWTPDTPMRRGVFGIREPDVDARSLVRPLDLELVLVPLLGFDAACNRLGMGGGYYDRSFAARLTGPGPTLVGVAHQAQKIPELPARPWDVPLDVVLTDCETYRRVTRAPSRS